MSWLNSLHNSKSSVKSFTNRKALYMNCLAPYKKEHMNLGRTLCFHRWRKGFPTTWIGRKMLVDLWAIFKSYLLNENLPHCIIYHWFRSGLTPCQTVLSDPRPPRRQSSPGHAILFQQRLCFVSAIQRATQWTSSIFFFKFSLKTH